MTPHANPRGVAEAAIAMCVVGTLTAVSATLDDYPVFGGQAVRYAVAAVLLFMIARVHEGRTRAPRRAPRGRREWGLLAALAATGLAAFNFFVITATERASPATVGTVIAIIPVILALVVPLQQRRRPSARLVLAALVVTAGAALTNGFGGGSLLGLLLSAGALIGEVCFALLAVPLLPRLGAIRVSAWSAALAAPMLLATGLIVDGGGVLRTPTAAEAAALTYLTVGVTGIAFMIWYDSIARLGPDVAGLFAGLIPVSAVVTTVALGLGRPNAADLAGAVLVGAGVIIGVRPGGRRAAAPEPEPVLASR